MRLKRRVRWIVCSPPGYTFIDYGFRRKPKLITNAELREINGKPGGGYSFSDGAVFLRSQAAWRFFDKLPTGAVIEKDIRTQRGWFEEKAWSQ